jgi:hypothetical protein
MVSFHNSLSNSRVDSSSIGAVNGVILLEYKSRAAESECIAGTCIDSGVGRSVSLGCSCDILETPCENLLSSSLEDSALVPL